MRQVRIPQHADLDLDLHSAGILSRIHIPNTICSSDHVSSCIICTLEGSYDSALHSKAEAICSALVGERSRSADGGWSPSPPTGEQVSADAGSTGGVGYSFGVVHVKAVDDAGHDRMVQMKVRTRGGV